MQLEHDTSSPDIETASAGYAKRFHGSVGRWLLSVQEDGVRRLLRGGTAQRLNILEVGGGHAQLTELFVSAGHCVTVHASAGCCFERQRDLLSRYPGTIHLVASSLWQLPWPDRSFDLVVAIRLLAHVQEWRKLLAEITRVARRYVIVDYPALSSANILSPALFWAKRLVEGNTRPYFCYWNREIVRCLRGLGFEAVATYRQFVIPMGIHRAVGSARVLRNLENILRSVRVTDVVGSPVLLMAKRQVGAKVYLERDEKVL